MPYTLGQAAKATGKDRATISRAIRKGKISADKDAHGQWAIDPAELHRVYPARATSNSGEQQGNAPVRTGDSNADFHTKISVLNAKLEAATQQLEELRADKAFLQGELAKATTLLTDQRPRRPWWNFWRSSGP